MFRLTILILPFAFGLINKAYSQKFEALTSKIFFNIDVSKQADSLLSDFNARAELTLNKDSGWTMYPPTDVKGNLIPFYLYSFSKHPYFSSSINEGSMMVLIRNDTLMGMSVSVFFDSKLSFDSTYNKLNESYRKFSAKVIRRPSIARPFEVTKFISKNGRDFIIITKGEMTNDFYLNISYNYQGYEW